MIPFISYGTEHGPQDMRCTTCLVVKHPVDQRLWRTHTLRNTNRKAPALLNRGMWREPQIIRRHFLKQHGACILGLVTARLRAS
jgi:hypothetical protein